MRRPAAQVRGGRKWAWLPVVLVNGIGPLTYFALGRRAASNAPVDAEEREAKRKKKGKSKKNATARTDSWEM